MEAGALCAVTLERKQPIIDAIKNDTLWPSISFDVFPIAAFDSIYKLEDSRTMALSCCYPTCGATFQVCKQYVFWSSPYSIRCAFGCNGTDYVRRNADRIFANVKIGEYETIDELLQDLPIRSRSDAIKHALINIQDMPYICRPSFEIGRSGCGDSLFWSVVMQKEDAILPLIELLDCTETTAIYFPNYGGPMTVADVARTALSELLVPLPKPSDFHEVEDLASFAGSIWIRDIFWLQSDVEHRVHYKANIMAWYIQNKTSFVWIESNRFQSGDMSGTHPNGGHFELRK